jgi:hypothetical protein
MLDWYYCHFDIWKSLAIWYWKIQLLKLFNYLISFDTKNDELKLKLGLDNWMSLLNLVIWIDFVKNNWIEKGQFGTKTHLLKHSLLQFWGALSHAACHFST